MKYSGRHRFSIVLQVGTLVLFGAVHVSFAADIPPITIDDIDPAGIRGALLLCGNECTPAAILDVIAHQDENRSLVILQVDGGESLLSSGQIRSAGMSGALQHCAGWDTVSAVNLPDRHPRTVWIHADAFPTAPEDRAEIDRWLNSFCDDDTALVVSGAAVPDLCAWVGSVGAVDVPVTCTPGLGRLPGVIFWPSNLHPQVDPRAVRTAPGWLHLALHPQGMLLIRGRHMLAPGRDHAGAVFHLSSGDPSGLDTVAIHAERPTDMTQLRRIAASREMTSFPPPERRTPRVENGALVIVGGGNVPDGILAKFVELAGGAAANIVVIPTAAEGDHPERHRDVERFLATGAAQVTTLHTRDRERAKSPEFLAPLTHATGVWFTGGRQWRLVDAYEETPLVQACHAVLDRGGVIGGNSAGATIQGEYLVRGHPLGNGVMMAAGYERGFGFLPGTAIDQHFTQRKRERDLESVKRRYPQLVCVGIDEATTLLVQGTIGEVLGDATVSIYDAATDASAPEAATTRIVLNPGDRYDFQTRTPLARRDQLQPIPTPE